MARKKEETTTAVETIDKTKLALASRDAALLETVPSNDFDSRDVSVPRIKLLQALSPECTKGEAVYMKDARAGDILLPDGTLIEGDSGFQFIPVAYKREGLVFGPNRGGFVANLGTGYDEVLVKCSAGPNGERMTPEGNELVETATYFGFVLQDGGPIPAVICMNKTQWRSAKKLNGLISQFREKLSNGNIITPPIYWRVWKFTTDPTKNEKGNWFLYTTKPDGNVVDLPNGRDLFETCKAFREEVMQGTKVARYEDTTSDS